MMIFSLVVMIGLERCCITSAYLQWLCQVSKQCPVSLLFLPCKGMVAILFFNSAEPFEQIDDDDDDDDDEGLVLQA